MRSPTGSVRTAALSVKIADRKPKTVATGRRMDRRSLRYVQAVGCVTRKWVKRYFD